MEAEGAGGWLNVALETDLYDERKCPPNLGNHLAADDSDEYGDRIPALTEYALGLSPLAPDANAVAAQRLRCADGERLRLMVNRDPDRSDLTFEVQAASQMSGPWQTVASSRPDEPFTVHGYVGADTRGRKVSPEVCREA